MQLLKGDIMSGGIKIIAKNRKARFEYFIDDKLEVGMVLGGTEVKSLRDGRVNLSDGYAVIKKGELWLQNVHISPYPYAFYGNHDPLRPRKLLAHKIEIVRLVGKTAERGYSLIPLLIYFKNGRAKVELGLAKGKKNHDKRQTIRERQDQRDAERAMARRE